MDTPLHMAVSGGHLDCVDLLLRKGADPNVVNNVSKYFQFISMNLFQLFFKGGSYSNTYDISL